MEPFLPWKSKFARFCVSITTVIFWVTELFFNEHHLPDSLCAFLTRLRRALRQLCMIMACIIGVIVYRLAVYAAFASILKDPMKMTQLVGKFITPQLATSVTASCINFVLIMILNFLYERVAVWITDLGKPESRHQSRYPPRRLNTNDKNYSFFFFFVQRSPKPTLSMRTG